MSNPRYAYSMNGESYHGDHATREDAVYQADADTGTTVWTGEIQPYSTRDFAPSAWRIIEIVQEEAGNVAGECAEDWLEGVGKAAEADLEMRLVDLMDVWLTTHNLQPHFFTVEHVQEHVVGVADEPNT